MPHVRRDRITGGCTSTSRSQARSTLGITGATDIGRRAGNFGLGGRCLDGALASEIGGRNCSALVDGVTSLPRSCHSIIVESRR